MLACLRSGTLKWPPQCSFRSCPHPRSACARLQDVPCLSSAATFLLTCFESRSSTARALHVKSLERLYPDLIPHSAAGLELRGAVFGHCHEIQIPGLAAEAGLAQAEAVARLQLDQGSRLATMRMSQSATVLQHAVDQLSKLCA